MAENVSPERDVFISHAGEDKKDVARPLAEALTTAGWSVWLDQYELTVGDSLNESINAGLSRSRFGVVILSHAFFSKHWPMQELNGLAAREAAAGSKVILPVWHGIDHKYLSNVAPMLADRLGVSTDEGIGHIAQELIRALERERRAPQDPARTQPVVRSVASTASKDDVIRVPRTQEERDLLLQTRPDFWEYLLFAGVLLQGKNELEPEWRDHELRLPRGPRRELDQATTLDFISGEVSWIRRQIEAIDRVLDPSVQAEAFGAPGEPGDPARIEHMARCIVKIYESLLDSAASLRNTSPPSAFAEVVEASADLVDQPIREMREFIEAAVEQISRVPELIAHATAEDPATITLTLTISVDDAAMERCSTALQQAADDAAP